MYRVIIQNTLTGAEDIWQVTEEYGEYLTSEMLLNVGVAEKAQLTKVSYIDKEGNSVVETFP